MEYDLEHKIRLTEESKFNNLYKWSLQETDESGNQIGNDQVPWSWTLWFTAIDLCYQQSIEGEGELVDSDEDASAESKSVIEREFITGKLRTGLAKDGEWQDETHYSMFGTTRIIKDFDICIEKHKHDDPIENCSVWGCVRYTSEVDFRYETQDDFIQITLFLSADKFERLAQAIRSQQVDVARLTLGNVSGLYSDWSPSIRTRHVKVLATGKEQEVLCADGSKINPPRLGKVGEFELTTLRRCGLSSKYDTDNFIPSNDLYDIRKKAVEQNITKQAEYYGEKASEIAKYSQYTRLIEKLTYAAVPYVETSGDSHPADHLSHMIDKGIEVIDSIQSALTQTSIRWSSKHVPPEDELKSHYNFWTHHPQPIQYVKEEEKIPYIDKGSLIEAVSEYLMLPYRSAHIDRFLVDVLVAQEMYAFGDQTLNETKFPFLPVMSPLKRPHPLTAFFKNQFWNGVILFGLASLSLYAGEKGWIGYGWGVGIALVLGAVFVFYLVMSLIGLPSAWINQAKAKTRTIELLESMTGLYSELESDGPISSRHITHIAEVAAEKGVIWTSSLFVLLDDINNRTGKF